MKKLLLAASITLCGLATMGAGTVTAPATQTAAPASAAATPAATPAPAPAPAAPVVPVDPPNVLKAISLYPETIKRITAYGKVCVQGASCDVKLASALAPSKDGKARDGSTIYEAVCTNCHATGLLGSPKFGSAADWAPRIAKGKPTLYDHAIHGFNSMPARGGNADLTDEEMHNAVDYMVSKAS